jgi:DNA polymerase (family X)
MHRLHRMKNLEVARQFDLMADVLELKGENPFRIRAYRRAAQNLESLTEDVQALAREDRLEEIPGIGADLAGKIQEYLRTGRIKEVAAASKGIPRGVVDLMSVPGIGPKTAKLLYEREGITGMDELEKLASKDGLRGLPGIQAKTEQNILKGIRLVRGGQERMPLGRALALGRELVHTIERLPTVKRISLAGSVRRMKDTVGDIDILVTSSKPESVMRGFVTLPQVADVLEHGTTKGSIRHREGIQAELVRTYVERGLSRWERGRHAPPGADAPGSTVLGSQAVVVPRLVFQPHTKREPLAPGMHL